MTAQQGPTAGAGGTSHRERSGMVVCCTHGIADPLVDSLMLDYLFQLQNDLEAADVLLFTEEPPGATTAPDLPARLAQARIHWSPLHYDVGGSQWRQRIGNLMRMIRRTRAFARTHHRPWLIGHLSFGGAYAIVVAWFVRVRTMVVCFEPHSRYMIDLGIWPASSLKARVMGWLEKLQMSRSDVLIVPTRAVRDVAASVRPRGAMELQAITIDVERAKHDPRSRMRLRNAHAMDDDATVIIYAGKFGGIYHTVDQYIAFMTAVSTRDEKVRWCVVTQEAEIERIQQHPHWPLIADRLLLIPPVPSARLHEWLSMADLGVVAIPPTPSQAFRTPVKTAHYWAAGLPIVIPRGVSDDFAIAESEGVGLVVDDLIGIDAGLFVARMKALLSGDRESLRQRCIAAARKHRDSGLMVDLLRRLLSA